MKKTITTFDCVEMMHKGALRIYEETTDMTREQELAYWKQKGEEAYNVPDGFTRQACGCEKCCLGRARSIPKRARHAPWRCA